MTGSLHLMTYDDEQNNATQTSHLMATHNSKSTASTPSLSLPPLGDRLRRGRLNSKSAPATPDAGTRSTKVTEFSYLRDELDFGYYSRNIINDYEVSASTTISPLLSPPLPPLPQVLVSSVQCLPFLQALGRGAPPSCLFTRLPISHARKEKSRIWTGSIPSRIINGDGDNILTDKFIPKRPLVVKAEYYIPGVRGGKARPMGLKGRKVELVTVPRQ